MTGASAQIRPWQFFVLAALMTATVGVFLSRGTSPANIIFISVTIGAAALAGMAVYRMLLPLVAPEGHDVPEMVGGRTRVALEREKMLVLRSIKELEFDRAMDKISEPDYQDMVARLRARAVRLIRQLDAGDAGYRELIERELASRLGRSAAQKRDLPVEDKPEPATIAGACTGCDTVNEPDARFCKHCGMKLMATLLLAFMVLLPSILLAQPDPRQMSGIPRPDGNLPDGTITVRVIRGSFANNVIDHPVELRAGDQVQTARTDANGRATFRAPAKGTILRASTEVDGARLESQEFQAPSAGGVAVMLVASGGGVAAQQPARPGSVSLGPRSRLVVDLENDTMQIYYLLEIVNSAPYPVTTAAPVILDLPSGAGGAGAIEGSSPQVVVRGSRITVPPPFQPGTTPVNIAYTMPYSGAELTISQKLPAPLPMVSVVMRKLGEMQIQSPQLTDQQASAFEGRSYVMATGPALKTGDALTFDLKGLPHHSRVPRTVTGILAGLVVLIGLWGAFSSPERSADAARRKRLETRREKTFAELVKLEEQKRAGKIDTERHQSRRASLIAQLERIYGELDSEGAATGGGPRRGVRGGDPAGGDEGLAA